MIHTAPAVHALRLPLLAATAFALALAFALGMAGPAAAVGFVDDATPAPGSQDTGFEATGEGFIDAGTADAGAGGHDGGHDEAAPVGGVGAGFGGMAGDEAGLGLLHAVAAGLLGLVALGLAAHRRVKVVSV